MTGAAPPPDTGPGGRAEPAIGRHRWLAWAWLVIVLATVAHNGWIWFVERRVPETDILALLPAEERDRAVNVAIARVADVAQQRVVVLIGHRDWARARRAADAYRQVLDRHREWFTPDTGPARDQARALDPWWARRGALLSAADRRALQSGTADSLAQSALRTLNSPLGMGRMGAWQDDPFGLFGHWLQARAAETPVRPADGALRVADGDVAFVLLPLSLSAQAFSLHAQQAVVPVLDSARAAAMNAEPGTRVVAAGLVLFAADAAQRANREVSIIGWGSLAGIVLLMWFTFRSLWPIGMVVISLAVGTVGALSVCALLFDKLHFITLVFGASLVGVAEDYGILYLCQRIDAQQSAWATMRAVLPGLLFALLTTVVAYLALALTPFPGLRQMAAFAGAGLIFAWISVAVWFPRLERRPLRATGFSAWLGATRARWPRLRLNGATLIAATLASVAIGAGLVRLTTNDDIRQLNYAPPALVDAQREVGRILRAPAPSQFFVVRGPSEQGVLAREEALRVTLDSLVAAGALTGYHAVSAWVPSLAQQARDRALVVANLLAPAGPLDRLASALGEGAAWTRAARQRLTPDSTPLTIDFWRTAAVSEPYRQLWLGPVDGRWATVVAVRGVDAANLATLRYVADAVPDVIWVDKVADVSALLGRYRRLMGWVVVASYAALLVLILPRYGRSAWRVVAPSIVGSLFALAVFGWLGQPVQLFHVLALLLIFGSGVDYGIFLQEHAMPRRRHKAWIAVVLSAASTSLSFGLLGLSATPALRTFGVTLLLGIGSVTLIAPCFCTVDGNPAPAA